MVSFAFQVVIDTHRDSGIGLVSELLELLANAALIEQENVDTAFSYAIQTNRVDVAHKIIAMHAEHDLALPTVDAANRALVNVADRDIQRGMLALLNGEIPGAPIPTRTDLFSKIRGYHG